jgi:hypothetical protein
MQLLYGKGLFNASAWCGSFVAILFKPNLNKDLNKNTEFSLMNPVFLNLDVR